MARKKAEAGKQAVYSATLSINGKKTAGKGGSVMEAIKSIEVRNPRGKAVLTVSNGDTSKDKVLPHTLLNRLFNSHGMIQEVALKQVSTQFQGL